MTQNDRAIRAYCVSEGPLSLWGFPRVASARRSDDRASSSCGVILNELEYMAELFNGGNLSGQLCFLIPQADVDSGPMLSTHQDDVRYYLAMR